jgi:hypothetical protein
LVCIQQFHFMLIYGEECNRVMSFHVMNESLRCVV